MTSTEENVSLLSFNTFGIAAKARFYTVVRSVDEVKSLITSDIFKKQRHFILGGGSNLLLTKDYDGLVIKNEIMGIRTVAEDDTSVTLEVGAGENWHKFVMYCVDRNLGGLENLSLIPGTVGAAPMQNIGAYGVEVKRNILSVSGIDLTSGSTDTFDNAACHFGYRESVFKHQLKGRYLISSVVFRLTKTDHQFNTSYGAISEILAKQQGHATLSIKAISDAVIAIRRSKLPDPTVIGNAGSFFKNPSVPLDTVEFLKKTYIDVPFFPDMNGLFKIPAGWLIEQCGWKGKRLENIGVHEHQALVLVNYGGGAGNDIWQLAMRIQESVREKFDITLHPEVNVI